MSVEDKLMIIHLCKIIVDCMITEKFDEAHEAANGIIALLPKGDQDES